MKLIKIKYCAAIAVIAFATGFTFEANAQQAWNQGYTPSCSERGGCQHGNDSLELNPYGQSYGYGNGIASTRIPYRDTYRTPYQSSVGEYSGGCGNGGTCGQSRHSQSDQHNHGGSNFDSAGRCPFEQRQFEQASFAPQSTYGNQRPYGGGYESDPSFNTRPDYATPSRRSLESYQPVPADRRPELRTSPSLESQNSFGRNESRVQSRELTMPPTSSQIMPPRQLPPQPSASNSRQSSPQLMPPTTVPSSQQSANDHAGHDHSGHDHSGHSH